MTVIPLTRCQFLMPFVEIHTEIGGPTAALLAKLDARPECTESRTANFSIRSIPTKFRLAETVNFAVEGRTNG